MQDVAQETREVHKKILNGSWRATNDADELRKIFESECSSLDWQRQELEQLRSDIGSTHFWARPLGDPNRRDILGSFNVDGAIVDTSPR